MSIEVIVVLVLIIGAGIYSVMIYNGLVALKNRFKNAFSQIDVQLKRRYDLIPNLVETAKAYMKHEREALESVIRARNNAATASERVAMDPSDQKAMQELIGSDAVLSGALGHLFALSESYPDLKADQTMTRLMEELTATENKVSFARQAYNDAVMAYNTAVESFPDMFIAGPFNFASAELWELEVPQQREPVPVSF